MLWSIVIVGKIQTSTNPRHAARPYMVSLAVLRFEVFVRMYACWFSPKATCHASKSSCVNLVWDWPSLWCCKYVKSHSGFFNPLSILLPPKKYPIIKFMVQCSNSAGWKAIKIFICRGKWYVLIILHTKFAIVNYNFAIKRGNSSHEIWRLHYLSYTITSQTKCHKQSGTVFQVSF